ncbi:PqqD family protein [Sinanaerobacter sp. ZZT-01]|uniref:PqqD family protein n=1 Tax=Sinanaerobacter sp. ZZT-01 TaxID=3111540 RepID=UPI002D7A347A|nr:PqqD family protein [Sinanaerobacter sp. ZZT-01]WRR92892.1 PqqD family protein [Sinanaerobacter sp. ZZT-01]
MGRRSEINYLDYIPKRNDDYVWKINENDKVVVSVTWTGFYHRFAQKVFKKPESSHIELDEFGSFIWLQIDGKKTIFDISQIAEEKFGEKIYPLIERMIQFFEILKEHKFVTLKENHLHA